MLRIENKAIKYTRLIIIIGAKHENTKTYNVRDKYLYIGVSE